ncbi:MAG: hypothetical protein PHT33_14280 [bacterium]|nr:hypothetical protein [bacterium]
MAIDYDKMNTLLANIKPKASLVPSLGVADSAMPIAPEYKAYKQKSFNSHADGPGGFEWEKGIKSKQLHDQEQQFLADQRMDEYKNQMTLFGEARNQYNADRTFKTNAELETRRRLENQYADMGEIAPMSDSDITPQIRRYGEIYTAEKARGNMAGAEAAHQAALALASGTGWIQPGQNVESVSSLSNMTSAGMPTYKRQSEEAAAANAIENQDWYMPLARAQAEATLANTQRSANAPYSSGSSGGGSSAGTQTERERANYGSALNGVMSSLNTLMQIQGSEEYANRYGSLDPIQVIENQVNKQSGYLSSAGIDPALLLDDSYKAVYGVDRDTYWASANEGLTERDAAQQAAEKPWYKFW